MARPLRAARLPPPLLLLLAAGVSLGACAVSMDEPGPEGLTSTSLLDLLLPTDFEPLDSEEPSEAMGLGAGLAPGSGFPSEDSEESRLLQPPQYFWEEEELNGTSLDLGPTADYIFPDLTEKEASMEDPGQAQDLPDLPSILPKTDLAEPPWHMPLEEEDEEEEEEEEEEEREKEEAEEEEELLPVSGSPEGTTVQAHDSLPSTSSTSSQGPGATRHRQEDSGDQATSGMEVESSVKPTLSVPSVTPSTVALGDQNYSQEFPGTEWPAGGLGVQSEVTQGAGEEATPGAPDLDGQQWALPSSSFPQTVAPSGTEVPSEGHLYPRTPDSFPPEPHDTESTPSSATWGQEGLSEQPLEGQAAEAQSLTPWDSTQVICKDWSNLAGKSYIILNMTENIDCEVFRRHRGLQLLALVEEVLPRHRSGHRGDWHISLSKPSEKEQHLLMTLVGEQGVVPTQDVLSMLSGIRRSLEEIGIQNYSTTSSCQARATQVRSDYGTLFVVLVIIGVICFIIIVLGLLYNCWQRRLPKLKHVSHGEELRFVENGCHDNPTLDVASDSQSEMQEKQPSLNGGGAINGPSSWSALMGSKRDPEDSDMFEEDTHL
ncbi:podocalyxin-like protein 2 [Mesocricetus auratus]|uniref:Podocalyxin-like protein 2 n=1 Tax=Mesocricetus auratus TaxID=10036 RepID=A0A1U7QR08_MESAU|nr:podocalyxin-like protein 2 [Mesocricetus auratus]